MLLTRATDELSLIRWLGTEDGRKGINRPNLLSAMFAKSNEDGYDTPEDFMRAYYGE